MASSKGTIWGSIGGTAMVLVSFLEKEDVGKGFSSPEEINH